MKNKLYILLFLAFLFSGTTLWAQQKATPKAGEGISSFLLRHNRSPKKYYDDFIELNKQRGSPLGVHPACTHRVSGLNCFAIMLSGFNVLFQKMF